MRQVPMFDPTPVPPDTLVSQDVPVANAGSVATLYCDAGRFWRRS
jgi:hypothetical protein